MRVIVIRPFVIFAVFFVGGIIVSSYIGGWYFLAIILGLVSLFFFEILSGNKFNISDNKTKTILLCAIGLYVIGGMEYLYINSENINKFKKYIDNEVILTGYITSEPDIGKSLISYELDVYSLKIKNQKCKSANIGGKLLIFLSNKKHKASNMTIGTKIEVCGKISIPSESRNPGGFNYRKYLFQRGIQGTMIVDQCHIFQEVKKVESIPEVIGRSLQKSIVKITDQCLPEEQASLMEGILIGYRKNISEENNQYFNDSGITHIMAVSGTNVAYIIVILVFVFRLFRIRRLAGNVFSIIALILFIFVTGFEPSVLRAAIMGVLVLIASIVLRESDVITNICLSAIIILIFNPYYVFNIAFKLSFAATLALVLFYNNLRNTFTKMIRYKWMIDTLAATMAAQLGVLPMLMYYFNQISIISILTNLIILPVVGLISITGMVMVTAGYISIFMAGIIGKFNLVLINFILQVSKLTANLPFAVITVATPKLWMVILYYVVVIGLFAYSDIQKNFKILKNYIKKYILLIIAVTIISIVFFNQMSMKLEVIFLDVGEGDSIFVKTPNGKTFLIDGGNADDGELRSKRESIVKHFLLHRGISKIDVLLITHPHDDHMKGSIPIIRYLHVGKLIIPCYSTMQMFREVIEEANNKGIKVEMCEKGDIITLDSNVLVKFLYPSDNSRNTRTCINNESLVFKLIYNKISFLFTGDAEEEVENFLIDSNINLEANILKVAHHGSSTSTTNNFIDRISPSVAVISVGKNSFGHPSQKVLDRFKSKGISVFRTDQCGGIIVKCNGESIWIDKTIK